jgi:RNA polymerase sigma-70 factor (ECF subfamily)
VFCRLAEGRTELEPGREKAWLLTCAANACKNRFRFLRRWEGLPLETAEAVPDESGRAVLEAVLSLPEKYRAPVHLYYYEGYSQKEIAEILDLRLTAVQTRMQRARAILKEVLSDDDAI